MSDCQVPEIRADVFFHKSPGWEEEWQKIQTYLFVSPRAIVEKVNGFLCYHNAKNELDDFTQFLWLYFYEKYAGPDPIDSSYDPNKGISVIDYLVNSSQTLRWGWSEYRKRNLGNQIGKTILSRKKKKQDEESGSEDLSIKVTSIYSDKRDSKHSMKIDPMDVSSRNANDGKLLPESIVKVIPELLRNIVAYCEKKALSQKGNDGKSEQAALQLQPLYQQNPHPTLEESLQCLYRKVEEIHSNVVGETRIGELHVLADAEFDEKQRKLMEKQASSRFTWTANRYLDELVACERDHLFWPIGKKEQIELFRIREDSFYQRLSRYKTEFLPQMLQEYKTPGGAEDESD